MAETPGSSKPQAAELPHEKADSLLEGLLILCRFHGISTTKDALIAGLPVRDGRLSPALFRRAAMRVGLVSNVIKKPLTSLRSDAMPALLLLEDEEVALLYGWGSKGQNARVVFPELGNTEVSVSFEELSARYSGYAIVSKPRFRFDQRAPEVGKVKLRHWFWGTLAENSVVYRDVLLAALLINVFALVLPLFTMNVYDRVVPNRSVETLWMLVAGVILVVVADFSLRSMRGYFLDWASNRVDIKLSGRIMEQVLGMRLEQKPASVGSFAANLRSFETVRDFITSATITALVDLPFGLLFVGVIAWIAWPMMLPVLAGAVVLLIYALSIQSRMHVLSESMYRAGAIKNATLIESLVGLETVKALGIEGQMQRKWEQSVAFLGDVSSKIRLLAASVNNGAGGIQQLVTVTLVLLGVYMVIEAELSIGGLIACTMLSSRALAPVAQIAGLITQYHNASTALTSLNDIMAKSVERPANSTFLSRQGFAGNIEFHDVSFNYPGSDVPALKGMSFRIHAGEHVAILGRMGSGKSTLHKLILGLYQPTSGSILIDGVDSRQLDPAELRRCIGYVPQETSLFFGSMRDNITITARHADDAAIIHATRLGGIEEFINTHPKGFDMYVGERGETLSGGQRQGVGIARALINSPNILLLDEPTSAMDHSGEELVKKRLAEQMGDKTLLLITHRSSLFDLVNRIIVVDGGKVVADGEKNQIMDGLRAGVIGKAPRA